MFGHRPIILVETPYFGCFLAILLLSFCDASTFTAEWLSVGRVHSVDLFFCGLPQDKFRLFGKVGSEWVLERTARI